MTGEGKHKRNFIIVILVVLALSCVHVFYVVHYVHDEIRSYQTRLADMNIQALKERLSNDTDILASLATLLEDEEKGFWRTAEAKKMVGAFVINTNFNYIGVADTEGTMYLVRDSRTVDVSDRKYYQYAVNGKKSIESIVINNEGNEFRSLNIGLPIYKNGVVKGVVCGSYAMDDLNELLPTGLHDKGIYSFIVRSDGVIISDGSDKKLFLNIEDVWSADNVKIEEKDYNVISRAIKENERGTISYNMDGEMHYLISVPFAIPDTYAPVGAAYWNLIIDIPARYILEKAAYLLMENIGYTLLVLGLFLLLSLVYYRQKNKKLRIVEKRSRTDEVTGGYNRRALEQEFDKIVLEKDSMTLFLVDLDNFKQVNDQYGHFTGDKVLFRFFRILDRVSEENDGFAGRLGGDEFLLCIPNISRELAIEIASGIVHEVTEVFPEYEKTCKLGTTIGISSTEKHGDHLNSLLESADKALYEGKSKGKQCVTFAE